MKRQTKYRDRKSPRYAFMEIFDIPDNDGSGDIYLRRWRVIQTPLCALYVHKIMRPDHDRELHDHPWNFIPIIIRGGYTEEVAPNMFQLNGCRCLVCTRQETRNHSFGSIRRMRATNAHRIVKLHRTPTWTVCLVGRRRRNWGFFTDKGWVPWQEFLDTNNQRKETTP